MKRIPILINGIELLKTINNNSNQPCKNCYFYKEGMCELKDNDHPCWDDENEYVFILKE